MAILAIFVDGGYMVKLAEPRFPAGGRRVIGEAKAEHP